MSCVWMLQRGHSGDGCVLASTLCKYYLRKGDLFVLSWARVRHFRIWCSSSMRTVTNTMLCNITGEYQLVFLLQSFHIISQVSLLCGMNNIACPREVHCHLVLQC